MLKHPPHTSIDAEILPEMEKRLECHSSCVKRAFDIAGDALGGVLVGLEGHDAVPEVASEEEVLPQTAGIFFGHGTYSSVVRGRELDRETAVECKVLAWPCVWWM